MNDEQSKYAEHFRAGVPSSERAAMWTQLRAKRNNARTRGRAVAACVLAAAAALMVAMLARTSAPEIAVVAPGPLHLELGRADVPAVLAAAPTGAARVVRFDDDSRVTLGAAARIEVLENTATSFALKQAIGQAHYEVTPGGPRRWSVETTLARVEVVGTGFEIDANDTHVYVHVAHGVVLVSGELVPEHVQRLTAGQSLDVLKPVEALGGLGGVIAGELPRAGASQGKKLAIRDSVVDALWTDADAARSRHDTASAVSALSRIVREHASDERAGLAALTLGRLRMDVLSEPAQAAADFADALRLGLSPALREDATLRRCESLAASGQAERARAEAHAWLASHPEGAARFAPWEK